MPNSYHKQNGELFRWTRALILALCIGVVVVGARVCVVSKPLGRFIQIDAIKGIDTVFVRASGAYNARSLPAITTRNLFAEAVTESFSKQPSFKGVGVN